MSDSSETGRRLRKAGAEMGHLAVPLVREAGITALTAWQALLDSRAEERGSRELAIAFTDLVGFSSWALEAGDDAALELLSEVKRIEDPVVREQGGTVVKRLGDGLMAVFDDAPGALDAILGIQRELGELSVAGLRPTMRAGLHLGCPRRVKGDYLGIDVNIAARIAEGAKPGQLLLSDAALSAVNDERLGAKKKRFRGKGVPKDVGVFAVDLVGAAGVA